jgi:hypothetical protein
MKDPSNSNKENLLTESNGQPIDFTSPNKLDGERGASGANIEVFEMENASQFH